MKLICVHVHNHLVQGQHTLQEVLPVSGGEEGVSLQVREAHP